MSDYDLGIKTDEIGVYHYLDHKGRMRCTGFKPDTLEPVEQADTFGMELCEGCEKSA